MFVNAVHQAMPNIRVQAWLGDVVAPQKNPGMDLADAAVRDRVTTSSSQVLDQGFDGIHFDLEPLQSGSKGFLSLLDQVHAMTRARGVPLFVAAAQLNPRRPTRRWQLDPAELRPRPVRRLRRHSRTLGRLPRRLVRH